MAIRLKTGKRIEIIDGTLPEIYAVNPHGDRFQAMCFIKLLQNLGVDGFEVDLGAYRALGAFPEGIRALFRIQRQEDAEAFLESGLRECVLRASCLAESLLERLFRAGRKITLEVRCGEDAIDAAIDAAGGAAGGDDVAGVGGAGGENDVAGAGGAGSGAGLSRFSHYPADCLRLTGVSCLKSPDSMDRLLENGRAFGARLELVPSDRLHMAGAIALEACLKGADRIGVTFGGIGRDGGFAPLEELLVSLKVIGAGEAEGDGPVGEADGGAAAPRRALEELPTAVKLFKSLSGLTVNPKKPIIGSRIFWVESGIHADGIRKSPETYEPFNPEWVGLSRELVLGKHSGSRGVEAKLAERGIECSPEEARSILALVRKLSIEYGRELSVDELMELYYKLSGKEAEERHG